MVSILLSDYFLVRKRRLDVLGLYDPQGRYRYRVSLPRNIPFEPVLNPSLGWNQLACRCGTGRLWRLVLSGSDQ